MTALDDRFDRQLVELESRWEQRRRSRRMWAAMMLATDVDVCDSILLGRPVLARQLDPTALRRARRGMPAPDPGAYLLVRDGHLDAVAEGGPFA